MEENSFPNINSTDDGEVNRLIYGIPSSGDPVADRIWAEQFAAEGKKYFMPLNKLLEIEFKETEWLIENWIPAASITIMSGNPASYKTFLALDMAICISSGRQFLKKYGVIKAGVLYIDEENGERLMQGRIKKLTSENDLKIRLMCYGGVRLDGKKYKIENIIEACKRLGIKLVIFDSLIRIFDGDENSSTDMAKAFQELTKFKKEGIAVLITHHNRKNSTGDPEKDMRGSGDILASVDCQVSVSRKEKTITMHQPKLREGEESKPINIQVQNEGDSLSFAYQGDYVKSKQKDDVKPLITELIAREKRLNQTQIVDAIKNKGVGEKNIVEGINELKAEGVLLETPGQRNSKYYSIFSSAKT